MLKLIYLYIRRYIRLDHISDFYSFFQWHDSSEYRECCIVYVLVVIWNSWLNFYTKKYTQYTGRILFVRASTESCIFITKFGYVLKVQSGANIEYVCIESMIRYDKGLLSNKPLLFLCNANRLYSGVSSMYFKILLCYIDDLQMCQ